MKVATRTDHRPCSPWLPTTPHSTVLDLGRSQYSNHAFHVGSFDVLHMSDEVRSKYSKQRDKI